MIERELQGMSIDELKQLQEKIAVAIFESKKRAKKEARQALEVKAREMGFDLEELVSLNDKPVKNKKIPPKYADPENRANTWSGRGRKPKWVERHLSSGKSLEELKI